MKLFTIGFTKSTARDFFARLERAGVREVIDTRLKRSSQLSAFAKQDDLAFFLSRLSNIDYAIEDMLAPTAELLDAYRRKDIGWDEYAVLYRDMLSGRRVEHRIDYTKLDHGCLLCSEATADHCHRRLAAEYLAEASGEITVHHL